jgi:DNA-binding FadR family transcriptional regulator
VLEYKGATLRDIYDARSVIESPCAGMLARRRTTADIAKLRAATRPSMR